MLLADALSRLNPLPSEGSLDLQTVCPMQKQVPAQLRTYWPYQDELSIENGLILKGERVIIPQTKRGDIIEKIHQAHQGVEKCKL